MNLYIDFIFTILVYVLSIYLIFIKNSISINLCGWIILISHLYKDITNLPYWPICYEFCVIILAVMLK